MTADPGLLFSLWNFGHIPLLRGDKLSLEPATVIIYSDTQTNQSLISKAYLRKLSLIIFNRQQTASDCIVVRPFVVGIQQILTRRWVFRSCAQPRYFTDLQKCVCHDPRRYEEIRI